jgi:hypothetical protein
MKMQTLKCFAGHEWQRPAQRGRPPVVCAEHKAEPQAQVPNDDAILRRRKAAVRRVAVFKNWLTEDAKWTATPEDSRTSKRPEMPDQPSKTDYETWEEENPRVIING